MDLPFFACATVTLVSALVSTGFSVHAVRLATGSSRTIALYGAARSVAVAAAAVAPFANGSQPWLLAVATTMTLVQALDAAIGARLRDAMKTFGPASLAFLNGLAIAGLLVSS